jgi:hypothetical protein
MKTWSHKTRRERSAASLSGQRGLKRASRVLAGHGQHGRQEYGSMDSCTLTGNIKIFEFESVRPILKLPVF